MFNCFNDDFEKLHSQVGPSQVVLVLKNLPASEGD